MIFLTVGTQLPFDRLAKWLDELKTNELSKTEIFAQLGQADYIPKNFNFVSSLSTSKFSELITKSDLVISHAGMGTIIECALQNKKLIVVPRLSIYNEHRNDHQVDTVEKFFTGNMKIANTKEELISAIFDDWNVVDDSIGKKNTSNLSDYIVSYLSIIDQEINEIGYQHD